MERNVDGLEANFFQTDNFFKAYIFEYQDTKGRSEKLEQRWNEGLRDHKSKLPVVRGV